MSETGGEIPQSKPENARTPEGQKPTLRERTGIFFDNHLMGSSLPAKVILLSSFGSSVIEVSKGNFVGAAIRAGMGAAISLGADIYIKRNEARLNRQSQILKEKFKASEEK